MSGPATEDVTEDLSRLRDDARARAAGLLHADGHWSMSISDSDIDRTGADLSWFEADVRRVAAAGGDSLRWTLESARGTVIVRAVPDQDAWLAVWIEPLGSEALARIRLEARARQSPGRPWA